MYSNNANAGTGGSVNMDGTVNWSANFRFPPTAADLTTFRNQVVQASQRIFDATEGQLRYGTVTITCGARNEDAADMWVYPQQGRAGGSTWNDGSNLRRAGYHVVQFLPSSDDEVVAHEMAHHAFGLLDEYDEQPRHIGRCIEDADLTEQSHCLMQQAGGVSNTEFCTPMNHDPNQGEGMPCTPGAAPSVDDCHFYDPATMQYEATQQSMVSGHSCWSRLVQNFPFLTAPEGLPQAVAPAGFVEPVFVDNCHAATTVMLALDRSGSMGWHPNDDRGEVCGNAWDDDGDGVVDETTTDGGCAEPRIDYLRAAARGYVALANGRAQRVGVISFSDLATLDVPIQDVDAASIPGFNDAIDDLVPVGATAIGRALSSSATILAGEMDATKTIFLISDGHNTTGEAPETVVPALQAQGIRVFTISTGDASNDPTLGGIASMTRGSSLDAKDARTLVNAFVRQFARANNDGTLMPLFPYSVNGKSKKHEKPGADGLPVRSPESWVAGKDLSVVEPQGAPANNLFDFRVEEGTERITIALAGNMDDMRGFGVRVALDGPAGPGPDYLDTDVPDPSMKVTNDAFFTLVEVTAPNPGIWSLSVEPAAGAAPVQTGNVTIVTENPLVDLFTGLDRYTVDDPAEPVRLHISPHYFTELRDLDKLVASVRLPDGTVEPLTLQASPSSTSGQAFEAEIKNMPYAGTYEVRVYMRTGPGTTNDPGESLFKNAPANSVPVPILERTSVETFTVLGKNFACPGNPKDCDGDCLSEDKELDTDGDGIPDAFDHDSDNDEIPDHIEAQKCEMVDTDGDGTPDHLDTDSDGDDAPDSSDNCRLNGNAGQDDVDADGHGDVCDNCPQTANHDQADKDADGQGDVCDDSSGQGGGGAGGGAGACDCSTPGHEPTDPLSLLLLLALPLGIVLRAARRRAPSRAS